MDPPPHPDRTRPDRREIRDHKDRSPGSRQLLLSVPASPIRPPHPASHPRAGHRRRQSDWQHVKDRSPRCLFDGHGPLARTCRLGKWKVPRTSGTKPCAHSRRSWSPASRTEEIPMSSCWHLSRWSSPAIEVLRCSGLVTTESCRERAGDICAIIFGTRSPFILRRVPRKKYHFHLIVATCILSKELHPARYLGAPCRLGDNGCEDCMEWGLPTQDIVLC